MTRQVGHHDGGNLLLGGESERGGYVNSEESERVGRGVGEGLKAGVK